MKLKSLSFLLVFFLFFLGLSAQEDTLWNQLNSNGEREGYWRDFYPNGNLKYRGQFKSGKPFSVFIYYYYTGELKTVLRNINENEAYATHYYSTGEMLGKGKYFNREKDSIWITFGANNKKLEEGEFVKGKKQGEWKVYYPDGTLTESKHFKDGIEDGPYKIYYPDGKLKQASFYKNGLLEGASIYYNAEGKKILIGNYLNDSRDGDWTYFDADGNVEKILKYENGNLLNPEAEKPIEIDEDALRDRVKDKLEFEDLRGKIKYE